MSHKASHWLADIPASDLRPSEFRVLFHLCDAHNSKRDPETACFPSQEQLRKATGLSNGGLNNALNAIESAGLMRRNRTRNPDGTRGPTYYILGCDEDIEHQPIPENGDGANSNLEGQPSPNQSPNHLHSGGVEPVREPVKEPLTPQPPSRGGLDSDLAKELIEAWPEDRLGNLENAGGAFGRLSDADRLRVVEAAPVAVSAYRRRIAAGVKRARIPALVTFIRERLFEDFTGAPEIDNDGRFVIRPGCPEWGEWLGHIRRQYGERAVEQTVQRKIFLPETRWPPGYDRQRDMASKAEEAA